MRRFVKQEEDYGCTANVSGSPWVLWDYRPAIPVTHFQALNDTLMVAYAARLLGHSEPLMQQKQSSHFDKHSNMKHTLTRRHE